VKSCSDVPEDGALIALQDVAAMRMQNPAPILRRDGGHEGRPRRRGLVLRAR